jgi:predicted HTH transcriptional regulator
VREVVANALIHADYHGRQGIVIDKYPERIKISNPGILRISKAVAVAGGTSDARNVKIFNIFSLVKIGERSGMGLSQLFGNWEEAGYDKPQLSEVFNPERTMVEIAVEVAEKYGEVAEKVAEKHGEVAEKVAEKLSETEERIIALIRSNAHITQKMLSDAIGLTRQYIGRCMDSLQSRNIIRRIGPDKGGYWEVTGQKLLCEKQENIA